MNSALTYRGIAVSPVITKTLVTKSSPDIEDDLMDDDDDDDEELEQSPTVERVNKRKAAGMHNLP